MRIADRDAFGTSGDDWTAGSNGKIEIDEDTSGGGGIADVDPNGAGEDEEAEGSAVDDDEPLEGSLGEHISVDCRSGRPRERLDGKRPPRRLPFCQDMLGNRR